MKRTMRRGIVQVAVVAVMVVGAVAPAGAVVDEIVAAACSGQLLDPPGINGSKHGQNVAQPLVASKVATFGFGTPTHIHIPAVDHTTIGELPGPFVEFDFTRPNVKIESLGFVINVGSVAEPFYLDAFDLKSDFPAHMKCKALNS